MPETTRVVVVIPSTCDTSALLDVKVDELEDVSGGGVDVFDKRKTRRR